jgi:hypothetical protein
LCYYCHYYDDLHRYSLCYYDHELHHYLDTWAYHDLHHYGDQHYGHDCHYVDTHLGKEVNYGVYMVLSVNIMFRLQ